MVGLFVAEFYGFLLRLRVFYEQYYKKIIHGLWLTYVNSEWNYKRTPIKYFLVILHSEKKTQYMEISISIIAGGYCCVTNGSTDISPNRWL